MVAKSRIILQAEVGSKCWGLNREDGLSDRDEMGVYIEDLWEGAGLSHQTENYIYRTAAEREGKHDAPSQPGDLDLTLYTLRKFLQQALKGNPTILTLLFVTRKTWTAGDARGIGLQGLTPHILSRKAGGAFLGYLINQRMRLTGERGGSHGAVHSAEETKYGYDTQ